VAVEFNPRSVVVLDDMMEDGYWDQVTGGDVDLLLRNHVLLQP
jgi:hypothetical protein